MEFSILIMLHPFFDGNLAFGVLLLVLFGILFEYLRILEAVGFGVLEFLDGLDSV